MSTLSLQKPSKSSKSRDHLHALKRRLQLWERGEIRSLLLETETIQQKLTSNNDLESKVCKADRKETSMGH